MSYWLIKTLLIVGLAAVTYVLVKPPKTESSLAVRRIGMMLVLTAAVFAIIFPEVFNHFARAIGVQSGTNLVVYLLVIALFAQMATSYRRDAAAEVKLTELARQISLMQSAEKNTPGNSGAGSSDPGNGDSGNTDSENRDPENRDPENRDWGSGDNT